MLQDGSTIDPSSWKYWQSIGDDILKKEKSDTLTLLEAYEAMIRFLEIYSSQTDSPFINDFIKLLMPLVKAPCMENSIWQEWVDACKKSLQGEVDNQLHLVKG